MTAAANRTVVARWEQEVKDSAAKHGEGELSPQELAKRVESMRKAHMTRLALISMIARRKRAEEKREAAKTSP